MFVNAFLGPCDVFRPNIGLLMFEFSRFYPADYQHGQEFVADLDRFLGRLPGGWPYGVEIRNRHWLRQDYFDCLARHAVTAVGIEDSTGAVKPRRVFPLSFQYFKRTPDEMNKFEEARKANMMAQPPEALTPITRRETAIAVPLLAFALLLGVYPPALFNYTTPTIDQTVKNLADWTIKLKGEKLFKKAA